MRRVAVMLSGCGVYDGTEIHEASAVMVNLARNNCEYECFAPNVDQVHVVDHVAGGPVEGQTRNVLVESSRIARGPVTCASKLNASKFSAIIVPGGFGAAKNLCDFALAPSLKEVVVNSHVEAALKAFHQKRNLLACAASRP